MNEDRALMRFELIEALLRMAITMRDNSGEDEIAPAEKVGKIPRTTIQDGSSVFLCLHLQGLMTNAQTTTKINIEREDGRGKS